jgi:hypothetical protein
MPRSMPSIDNAQGGPVALSSRPRGPGGLSIINRFSADPAGRTGSAIRHIQRVSWIFAPPAGIELTFRTSHDRNTVTSTLVR